MSKMKASLHWNSIFWHVLTFNSHNSHRNLLRIFFPAKNDTLSKTLQFWFQGPEKIDLCCFSDPLSSKVDCPRKCDDVQNSAKMILTQQKIENEDFKLIWDAFHKHRSRNSRCLMCVVLVTNLPLEVLRLLQ